MEIKTAESLAESLKDLINHFGTDSVYVELPKLDLNKIIIKNSEIHERCNENWADFNDEAFVYPDGHFREMKNNSRKEVNYLVKEFECRKSADAYARANTSRTGVLDCSKLHTYKYNEDLFKKVTTFPDGKNHGLIFVLDWSGSMQFVMEDTIKQLFNLIWFCRKVNIPFDVYAFTNEYPNKREGSRVSAYEEKGGLAYVGPWFSMMNILTSNVNAKTLEEQMLNIYRVVYYFSKYCTYRIPDELSLSGTPLNEAMVSLHQIIPQFKQKHKVQKVQCVVLTDGEAAPLKYHREVMRPWEDEVYLGNAAIHPERSFLRDRKTGNTYSFGEGICNYTKVLLENLRDNFPETNFLGIRLLNSGSDAGSFIRQHTFCQPDIRDELMVKWRKQKTFTLNNTGYHTYFGLSSSTLSNEASFEVDEGASKVKIKQAFMKNLRTKKMNKKVLSEFVDLIA